MSELYIGLMAGTSTDGIDAALVDFSTETPQTIATHYTPYTSALRNDILSLCQSGENEIVRMGELDVRLGKAFAAAALALLEQHKISADKIKAIGSHGQTIRHHPLAPLHFTLQIGDPNTIAALTHITVVADFRRRDLAVGGQGAPLVPAFHQYLFRSKEQNRAIVNIGGMANITLLAQQHDIHVIGYDTGPGNVLMDGWIYHHYKKTHDEDGAWAANGTICEELLNNMLNDPYFHAQPPKSTGREHFNMTWLQNHLDELNRNLKPEDVQATLAELTAHSIVDAVKKDFKHAEILICGGGAQNTYLMSRIAKLAEPDFTVAATTKYGIDPNWVEAIAFAWLAKQTLNYLPGNLPSVTGAHKPTILGGVYYS